MLKEIKSMFLNMTALFLKGLPKFNNVVLGYSPCTVEGLDLEMTLRSITVAPDCMMCASSNH